MGVEAHGALAIAHGQFRVVVLGMGNKGQRIHETNGLVEVFEGERFLKRAVDQAPTHGLFAIEVAQLGDDFSGTQRFAMTMNWLAHAVLSSDVC